MSIISVQLAAAVDENGPWLPGGSRRRRRRRRVGGGTGEERRLFAGKQFRAEFRHFILHFAHFGIEALADRAELGVQHRKVAQSHRNYVLLVVRHFSVAVRFCLEVQHEQDERSNRCNPLRIQEIQMAQLEEMHWSFSSEKTNLPKRFCAPATFRQSPFDSEILSIVKVVWPEVVRCYFRFFPFWSRLLGIILSSLTMRVGKAKECPATLKSDDDDDGDDDNQMPWIVLWRGRVLASQVSPFRAVPNKPNKPTATDGRSWTSSKILIVTRISRLIHEIPKLHRRTPRLRITCGKCALRDWNWTN